MYSTTLHSCDLGMNNIFSAFLTFFSFYERKYKVFLQLFAHQREYQALMNQIWPVVGTGAELEPLWCNNDDKWKQESLNPVGIAGLLKMKRMQDQMSGRQLILKGYSALRVTPQPHSNEIPSKVVTSKCIPNK